MRRAAPAAGLVLAALTSATAARAQGSDGLYGRFDGDLELRVHAGVAFASGGPGLAAQITASYLSTAGVYVHYTDALGSGGPAVLRSVSGGVHLQPFFLGRLGIDAERGPAFLDLLVDSFAFELGGVWAAPRETSWSETPGLEAAVSIAVPLLAHGSGPFLGLRGALRWRPSDFVAGTPGDYVDHGAVLSLTLGWHQLIRTHLVDSGDRVHP